MVAAYASTAVSLHSARIDPISDCVMRRARQRAEELYRKIRGFTVKNIY